jgi:hypothetical protein
VWKNIIDWFKKVFIRHDDIDQLYLLTYHAIKSANTKFKLKKSYILLQKLEEVTFMQYNNPSWMINRNTTLKLLWLQKFRRLTLRG